MCAHIVGSDEIEPSCFSRYNEEAFLKNPLYVPSTENRMYEIYRFSENGFDCSPQNQIKGKWKGVSACHAFLEYINPHLLWFTSPHKIARDRIDEPCYRVMAHSGTRVLVPNCYLEDYSKLRAFRGKSPYLMLYLHEKPIDPSKPKTAYIEISLSFAYYRQQKFLDFERRYINLLRENDLSMDYSIWVVKYTQILIPESSLKSNTSIQLYRAEWIDELIQKEKEYKDSLKEAWSQHYARMLTVLVKNGSMVTFEEFYGKRFKKGSQKNVRFRENLRFIEFLFENNLQLEVHGKKYTFEIKKIPFGSDYGVYFDSNRNAEQIMFHKHYIEEVAQNLI